ncbi:tetratricopeptide repeat protein [Bacteroidota bacterium]
MSGKKKQKVSSQNSPKQSYRKSGSKKKPVKNEIIQAKKYSRTELILVAAFALVIVMSGFFLYKPALDYDLVYCDDNIFLHDYYPFNKNPDNIKESFNKTMGTSYYRPILNVSIIMDTQWSLDEQYPDTDPNMVNPRKITPDIFHATNLVLHLLGSLFVFIFLLKLGYEVITSFLFGMIFVAHPLLTPAASWISGRNDSLITVFILLSFIAMTFYFERKGVWRLVSYVFHILFFAIALFTKEIAAFFPFIVFAYLILFTKRKKLFDMQYLLMVAGQFIIGLIWFFMRLKAIEGIKNPDTIGFEALPDNILSVPALIGKFFLPIKMIALSSYEWFSIGAGLFFIVLIIFYLVKYKKADIKKAWFGIIWFALLVFPTLLIRIVYVDDFFDYAEHRAYLVMIGLIIIEVLKSYKVDFKKTVPIVLMSIIILLMGYKSYSYRDEFQNRKTFWTHMTEMYPYKSRGYLDLGKAYLVEDSLDKAEQLYHLGIERNPDNRNLYIDLAAVYLKKKNFPEAEQYAKKALKIEPGNLIAYYNLGRAFAAQGKFEDAAKAMEMACRSPKYPDWFKDLGDTYYRLNKLDMAIQAYRRAISANPRNFHAYNNLGLAYANSGQYKEATQSWNRTLQLNPKMYESYYNLIRVSLLIDKNKTQALKYANMLKQQGGKLPPDIANILK